MGLKFFSCGEDEGQCVCNLFVSGASEACRYVICNNCGLSFL